MSKVVSFDMSKSLGGRGLLQASVPASYVPAGSPGGQPGPAGAGERPAKNTMGAGGISPGWVPGGAPGTLPGPRGAGERPGVSQVSNRVPVPAYVPQGGLAAVSRPMSHGSRPRVVDMSSAPTLQPRSGRR